MEDTSAQTTLGRCKSTRGGTKRGQGEGGSADDEGDSVGQRGNDEGDSVGQL
jgi:hypothetical protein